jgi:predicted nuclease with RNAse H fold
MKMLTKRAKKLNKLIAEKGYKTIEVHPTSTRKALGMPLKDWSQIQAAFKNLRLKGLRAKSPFSCHEIDAITAALTAHLHTQNKTEAVGNEQEGYVVIPKECNWKTLQL